MKRSLAFTLAALVLTLAGAPLAGAAPATRSSASSTAAAPADTALFAGGCFWCMETAFEGRPGVRAVVSGYSGGKESNPTYDAVSSHATGHLETVAIVFDPTKTTYETLLGLYWRSIDPTQTSGQFCDRGGSYLSAIFWRNEAQRKAAVASKAAIERSAALTGRTVVTKVSKAGPFWPAEAYHQDYWKKNPERYRAYREACGRDRRLEQLWGDEATVPLVH